MKKLGKKFTAVALLTSFFNFACAPVFADTTILGGGAKGGVITDLGGAQINSNTSNYAQIGITGHGNTILWNSLNVGKNKQLDFNFTQAGQVALNKVTGGSMSTFAGTLSTSGEAGRLIISNPAGMLFDKGAVVNANSLILTTKDVNWDGNLNGRLELSDNENGLNSSIRIVDNKTSQFVIAEDLNIIAPNIEVRQANDFLVNKATRLITTDGVTFVADSDNVETSIDTTNNAETGSVYVFDSKIAYQNVGNGKVYVTSRGDINFEKSTVRNAELTSPKNIIVKGGTMYTNFIEDSNLTAKTSITVSNHNTIKDSTLKLTETAKLDSVKITVNSNNSNHTHILNSDFQGRFINAEKAVIDSSTLKSVKNMKVSGSQINDSTLDSGFQVIAENTNIKDSIIRGTNTMTFDKFSTIDNSTITLDNVMNYSVPSASTLHLNDATVVNGTVVVSPKICANRVTVDNASINATDDMSIVGATLRNGASATTKNFIYDRNHQIIRDNSTKDVTVENSSLTAENDINVINGNLDGATLTASNSVSLNNVTSAGTADNNITSDTVTINDVHNFRVKAAAADITIDNSEITNDLTVDTADTLTMKDTSVQGLILSNIGSIDLEGVEATSINIADSGSVAITNSASAANPLVPTIAELAQGQNPIDDYNEQTHNPSDFENMISGNTYGENQRISYVSGNVNISNVSTINIVNTAIIENLTETDYDEANLVTSYVGGDYGYDNTNVETNIYEAIAQNIVEPVVDPVADPVVDPIAGPVADPVADPVVDPVVDPVADPIAGPVVDPVVDPIANPVVVETPVILPAEETVADVITEQTNVIASANSFEYDNSNDKTRFGTSVNTSFQKQFEVRGFAAGEDLTAGNADEEGYIAKKIKNVILSAKQGENNSIITTQKFIAE